VQAEAAASKHNKLTAPVWDGEWQMTWRGSKSAPKSDAHAKLGEELRSIRGVAGKTNREIEHEDGQHYSSGHIANVENGLVAPSRELVKAYSRLGGDLAYLLVLLDNIHRSVDEATKKVTSLDEALQNPASDLTLLRRGYRMEAYENYHSFGADRVPTESIVSIQVRTLSPRARYFGYRFWYENDPRPGVSVPTAGAGCELTKVTESSTGVIDVVIDFRAGRINSEPIYEFTIHTHFNTTVPPSPDLKMGFNTLMPRCTCRLQFDSRAQPESVWWVRGTHHIQNQPEPSHYLPRSPVGYYIKAFLNLREEYCGLEWRWS